MINARKCPDPPVGAQTAPGRGWTLAARRRPEEAQSGACAPPQGRPTRPPPISRGRAHLARVRARARARAAALAPAPAARVVRLLLGVGGSVPMQARGSGGAPALHTGGQKARARARAFALRPFGLSAPSALAARRRPAGSTAAQRRRSTRAPGGRFRRPVLGGRGPRARHSARTRERRSERANWPVLTRPTVRRLPIRGSSPDAAGRGYGGAARASGAGWRRTISTGDQAAARPPGAPVGRCAARKTPLSRPPWVDHPAFRHHGFATFRPLFCLGRLGPLLSFFEKYNK